jgi:hypothetical protein
MHMVSCARLTHLQVRGRCLLTLVVQVAVAESNFTGNQATGGAAAFAMDSCQLTFTDSRFDANNATHGGAVSAEVTAVVHLDSCVLDSNTAMIQGGALQANDHTKV